MRASVQPRGKTLGMGDHEDARTRLGGKFEHQRYDLVSRCLVEIASGFVGQEQGWLTG